MRPWQNIPDDVTVVIADLPDGLLGFCDPGMRTIWIRRGLRQRQRRAVLHHECEHLRRGGVCQHWCTMEERSVEEATARALIPLAALCDALRWTRDACELAEELHVPVSLMKVRAQTMRHPAERAAIAAVMADLAEMAVA